ncbi:MAG: D-alanine--D-alanine ligase [Bacteroidota bacterium]
MRVALVYNQKKEDHSHSSRDNDGEPPRMEMTAHLSGVPLRENLLSVTQSIYSNDKYAEWDTKETILAVKNALDELHNVTMIEADEHAYERLRVLRPDIVFNIAEGLNGVSREAQIPAMLELLQIPYSGSDPLTLATCLDKSRAKEILSYYGISTPKFKVVPDHSTLREISFPLPAMVKPLHEGSSKGIYNSSVVHTKEELQREISKILKTYQQPALVEEYLEGREFTVAMMGNNDNLRVLPIVEIKFDSLPAGVNRIYSYEAKWIWDQIDNPLDIYECPAALDESLKSAIENLCRKAYAILRCRDWCRIDVRLDSAGIPHIIELNPLPGILPNPNDNSCFPKAARTAGMSYNQMLQSVLALAAQRYGLLKTHPIPQPQFSGAL